MRVHKYRAWSKKWERWFLPEDIAVYGNGEVDCEYRGEPGRFGPGDRLGIAPREDVILLEYTRLADRNGTEMYDRDICEHIIGSSREYFLELNKDIRGALVIISHQNGAWGFYPVYPDCVHEHDRKWRSFWNEGDDEMWGMDYFTIVGSVPANPELLKKTA